MTGDLRDYDNLCEALEAYEGEGASYSKEAYRALVDAAERCGRARGRPVIHWARRRVQTYRQSFDAADFNQVRAIAEAENVTIASVMRRMVKVGLASLSTKEIA